jgi:DNA-binding MarR family transcriptional regulator
MAATNSGKDSVERLIDQWRRERPDVDPRVMGTVGRLLRAAALIGAEIDRFVADQGLNRGEADVLMTLRRAGPPYRLTPSAITRSLLITAGGMTGRLDRLEREGLIRRRPSARDRRSVEVELTAKAKRLLDRALPAHLANEERLLAPLSTRERATLDRLLTKLIAPLEP